MSKQKMALMLKVYDQNPELNKVRKVVEAMKNGGVVVYPTDTVYAFGCDMYNTKAIERITRIKSLKSQKTNFSIICEDISQISQYTRVLHKNIFKILKKVLPGPYTFIFDASNKVPKVLNQKRKTIGVRVPDNDIIKAIVNELGNPIITTSIKEEDELIEYFTDPELIYERYCKQVDVVIDGGIGGNEASTILDCTKEEIEVIREGLGEVNF